MQRPRERLLKTTWYGIHNDDEEQWRDRRPLMHSDRASRVFVPILSSSGFRSVVRHIISLNAVRGQRPPHPRKENAPDRVSWVISYQNDPRNIPPFLACTASTVLQPAKPQLLVENKRSSAILIKDTTLYNEVFRESTINGLKFWHMILFSAFSG